MAGSFGEAFEKAVANKLNKQKVESSIAQDITAWIKQSSAGIDARANGSTVEVATRGMHALAQTKQITFLDLKPFFQRSPKAKQKKNGGWYLVVPIGVKSRQLNQISAPDYKTLRNSPVGTTMGIGTMNRFQQVLQGEQQSGLVDQARYQWKSNNVTRQLTASGKRSSYISFRTVSDKSSPNSWIIGRQLASQENLPVEANSQMQADIKNLFLEAAGAVTIRK